MSEEKIVTKHNGRFQPGNRCSVGHSSRSQKLRAAVLQAISRDDIQSIMQELVRQARDGDQGAAKLILGFIGKASGDAEGPSVAVQLNQTNTAGNVNARAILDRIRQRRSDNCEG